jgi:hypothetical protein
MRIIAFIPNSSEVEKILNTPGKRPRSVQDSLASASSKITNLSSEVQALCDRAVQAEQVAKLVKTDTDQTISEVLRVLQEIAFFDSDLFKVTSFKLNKNLMGFRPTRTSCLKNTMNSWTA